MRRFADIREEAGDAIAANQTNGSFFRTLYHDTFRHVRVVIKCRDWQGRQEVEWGRGGTFDAKLCW
jgi:hypothetical protein